MRRKRKNAHRSGRRHSFAFSVEQLAQRAQALPVVDYPDLPVVDHLDELTTAIKTHQVVIVSGETGSGKTTQLPKICLQLGRGVRGMIGHTQPRRLAARTVAERIATELGQSVGCKPGQIVGYQVRFTDEVGPTTLVKLMTDGILLNEISFDPNLSRYDTIIVDEAHERSLNIDFILGYLTRLLPRRSDLKVIITSATIDSGKFAAHFEQAIGEPVPIIEVSGRTFPVQIRYRPLAPDLPRKLSNGGDAVSDNDNRNQIVDAGTSGNTDGGGSADSTGVDAAEAGVRGGIDADAAIKATNCTNVTSTTNATDTIDAANATNTASELSTLGYGLGETIDLEQGLCQAALELLRETDGDILAFLPGERDIHEAQLVLTDFLHEQWASRGSLREVEILPLFARLSTSEQRQIFAPHQRRRIVLATNIAETSLTVPGIRSVIDPGLARISRFSNKTKVQRLPIESVSQASSNQRSGRAGRVAPGVAIRLFSERDFAGRSEFTEPEILRTSLAAVILQMSALKLGEVAKFPFIDPPPPRAIRDGLTQLVEIGALTVDGKITRLGRQLSRLSVDPRLGRMLLEGIHRGCGAEMAVIVGALSIQDIRERPLEHQQVADQLHSRFADRDSDFITYLNMWRYLHVQSRDLSGAAFRRLCRAEFLHFLRFREWRDVVSQLRSMCQDLGLPIGSLSIPDRKALKQALAGASSPDLPDSGREPVQTADSIAQAVVEFGLSTKSIDPMEIHRAVLVGLLSNVGNWDEKRRDFAGTHGTHFAVWPGSVLHKRHPHWVMAAELVETSRVFARTVAIVQPEWIESAAKHLVKRSFSDPFWSKSKGAAFVRERVTLSGLTLAADRPRLLSQLKNTVIGQGVKTPSQIGTGFSAPTSVKGSLSAGLSTNLTAPTQSLTAVELAREMFICHALVLGEWRIPPNAAQFVKHNQLELEKAQDLADKQRNPALVPDEWALCSFFATRLPESVNSTATFERWWKEAKQIDAHLLDLRLQDLLPTGVTVDEKRFPSVWPQGQLRLPLTYSFAPGQSEDGMTVRIPLELLGQVRPSGFDWLVPGMLLDLCTEIIKALPKKQRILLVPAPQFAQQIAKQLDPLHPLARSSVGQAAKNAVPLPGGNSNTEAGVGVGTNTAATLRNDQVSGGDRADAPPLADVVNSGQDDSTKTKATTKNVHSLADSLERLQNWGLQNGVIHRSGEPTSTTQNLKSPQQSPTKSSIQQIEQQNSSRADSQAAGHTKNTAPALSFATAFAQVCQQLFGVEISSAQVEQAAKRLPAHLQISFAVTDRRGAIVGVESDLAKLQHQFAKQADRAVGSAVKGALQQALRQQKQAKIFAQATKLDQHGLTQFPQTALPECIDLVQGDLPVRGYPALVAETTDDNWAAGVQVYNNRDEASKNHFAGLVNLLALALRLPEQRITTRWSGREALLLTASLYPSTAALVQDAQWAASASLLESFTANRSNGATAIRDREKFDDLVQKMQGQFEDCVYDLLRIVVKAVEVAAAVDEAVAQVLQHSHANPDLVEIAKDCRRHRNRLLKDGFLSVTPSRYLAHLARYLQANVVRLQRARRGARELDQDFERWDSLDGVQKAYQQAELAASQKPFNLLTWLRLQDIRWQIEELRVSLFAEQLGTARKVSLPRLLREIQNVERDK